MTNSDYLIKATVKKISEKFNKTFFEKLEEASSAAQEVPEIFKKEFEILKKEIINEAKKMEEESIDNNSNTEKTDQTTNSESYMKIEKIKNQLSLLNKLLDK